MNQDMSCCQSFWEHVTCGWESQEPIACTASPEVFFSRWGKVSDPLNYSETREAPLRSHDGFLKKAGCANQGSGESVQKWAHQI